jgi:hypothetical protein
MIERSGQLASPALKPILMMPVTCMNSKSDDPYCRRKQHTDGVAQELLCSCRRELRDPVVLRAYLISRKMMSRHSRRFGIPGHPMLERSMPFRPLRQTLTSIRAMLSDNPTPGQQDHRLGAHKSLYYQTVIIICLSECWIGELALRISPKCSSKYTQTPEMR